MRDKTKQYPRRRGPLGPQPERCDDCGGLHVVLIPHAGRRLCMACQYEAKKREDRA